MDPNANLREQLQIANKLMTSGEHDPDPQSVERLAELVIALDDWLRNGGFLPDGWSYMESERIT